MHNLKEIRKNFPAFEKSLEKRLIDIDFAKTEKSFLISFKLCICFF